MEQIITSPGAALLFAGVLIGVLINLLISQHSRIKDLQKQADEHRSTNLFQIGTNVVAGNYRITSFDAGEHWYNFEYSEKGIRVIDEVTPERLADIQSVSKFVDRVFNNQGIDPANPDDLEALNTIGLTVKKTDTDTDGDGD